MPEIKVSEIDEEEESLVNQSHMSLVSTRTESIINIIEEVKDI
jgi:hypothetical protein